jgi:CRISPR-associated protein Csy1
MLFLPQVYEDEADVARWRMRFEQGLANLNTDLRRQPRDPDELWRLDWSNFYLGYQGQDDLQLQKSYARIVEALAARAAPQWTTESKPVGSGHGRLRIGFASSFFRNCTVGSYFRAWLTDLDPGRFDVHVFYYGNEVDATTESVRSSVRGFERTGRGAKSIASAIHRAGLDILVYPQLGMDGRDATLAALRLAPVQCAAWGHPETTGSSAIDWYFSCEEMEPANAVDHYSERLLLLPGLGTRYSMPETPSAARIGFGLPDDCRLYVCPHSLFKIHPDNDSMFADLLSRDPAARLVLCAQPAEPVTSQFVARLRRNLTLRDIDADGRVIIQPLRPPAEFRAMLSVCDVMLDTLHWSGGNTSLDALAAGLPIVSCAGTFMRGRQSVAMLRRLGLEHLVASTPHEAVSKAIEVASETGASVRRHIAQERPALFDRREPIAALAKHLIRIRA